MPVYLIGPEPIFPPPESADENGLLALGGNLDREWLLAAYRAGVFPWYDEPPIQWWCPDPRLVLVPDELKVSRSLRTTLRKNAYEIRIDTAFVEVMTACAKTPRHGQGASTWIRPEIIDAYASLHAVGFAHSFESWADGTLVGGLYGVCLGHCFFGESMFSRRADASKVALVTLARECKARDIPWIDCQVTTEHLLSLGAKELPRAEFLTQLATLVDLAPDPRPWRLESRPPAR